MGLFPKKVVDADMCFIRDLMEVAAAIAQVTSVTVGNEWLIQVIQEYGLVQKLYDYTHHNYKDKVIDCYPTDQNEKFVRAQELLKVANTLKLGGLAHCEVIRAASLCVKKMGFSYEEKVELIDTCIVELCGVESIDNDFIKTYMRDL